MLSYGGDVAAGGSRVPRGVRVCHDLGVHVVLVAGSESVAEDVARAWATGSPRSVVEQVVLSARPSTSDAGPVSGGAPRGVFVPTTSLGLASVTPPPVPPDVAHLRDRVAAADLVVVHVEVLDVDSLQAGRVADAAQAAAAHAVPVVVLAERSESTRREWSGAGVSGVHELGAPPAGAEDVVARIARTWAPGWA